VAPQQSNLSPVDQAKAEKAYALAYEFEQKYGNCPQCVLGAIQEAVGPVDDAIFKAGHALAGGAALTGTGTCGALSGGMLAIAAKYGRDRASFGKGKFLLSYQLSKDLLERFVAEFGSPICAAVQTNVLGRAFDLWDTRDFQAFETAGGHVDKCPRVAGLVARWTAEILLAEAAKEQGR
jgi:C_GCAxxG_C_C family probable redox protein